MSVVSSLKLHTLLGSYPQVAALKSGGLRSNLVEFDFADVQGGKHCVQAAGPRR